MAGVTFQRTVSHRTAEKEYLQLVHKLCAGRLRGRSYFAIACSRNTDRIVGTVVCTHPSPDRLSLPFAGTGARSVLTVRGRTVAPGKQMSRSMLVDDNMLAEHSGVADVQQGFRVVLRVFDDELCPWGNRRFSDASDSQSPCKEVEFSPALLAVPSITGRSRVSPKTRAEVLWTH